MAQKILASRSDESAPSTDLIKAKVDQVVLTRSPSRVLAEAFALGLKKTQIEAAVVYDGRCVTSTHPRPEEPEPVLDDPSFDPTAQSLTLARAGIGVPSAVHLERFAAPGRLMLTDDPKLATVGGTGMLTLIAPSSQLAKALVDGYAMIRAPKSVQILLSGRTRPFVCARDVVHELIRRNLEDTVRGVEQRTGAPVVLEFAGPSAKLLSVAERAVLASIAPLVGAVGSLFISDEKTEAYLRDQRRSKAHRALIPDAGAPSEEVVNIDLAAVDPLVMDPTGAIRSVRDVAGKPVAQVILGGDGTATARDFLAAATLLKSKKIGPRLDFLICPPSRQILEILAKTGALTDLLATGARLIEPDRLVTYGELYPAPSTDIGFAVRTSDVEPSAPGPGAYVVSAETLAYTVAHSQLGDPRAFKRPVRVQIPRELPTEDQLVVRERRDAPGSTKKPPAVPVPPLATPFKGAETLLVYSPANRVTGKPVGPEPRPGEIAAGPWAAVCKSSGEVRQVAGRSARLVAQAKVRAVFATHVPLGLATQLAGHGVVCLEVDEAGLKAIEASKDVALPAPATLAVAGATVTAGKAKVNVRWVALPGERNWVTGGSAAAPATAAKAR
ncbi:MAG: 3-isopropylmalate dehydratase [Deltaproteobacteria bacterium]|nr:3-isopropylmalate dehydratase [Deltaproteobacteria bacterium]